MANSNIEGISHITFICKDLEKTGNFLKQVFAAEEIYTSEKEKYFKIDNLWIAIMEGKATERTYNHIAFKVKGDLLELKKKIETLGLEILKGRPREQAEGQSLYFYDYDNHLFELHIGDLETRLEYYNRSKK